MRTILIVTAATVSLTDGGGIVCSGNPKSGQRQFRCSQASLVSVRC